jgi:uncharacterized phage-associated protein
MPYDSRAVASYLIQKSAPQGLDALQVLKLVYIAHGFTLGLFHRPLIDDDVEAWKYGPVIRRVYSRLPAGPQNVTAPLCPLPQLAADDQGVIDSVFDLYGRHSGLYLSSLTHRAGSPWERTWKTYGQNAVIPRDLIEAHYAQVIQEHRAAAAANRPYSPAAL